MTVTATLLLLLTLGAAIHVGRSSDRRSRPPVLTLCIGAVLLGCLLAQLRWPAILPALQRDAMEVREGQWYRLLTALWFQDGWLAGGVFNIAMLAAVGSAAERCFGRIFWTVAYLAGGWLAELVALAWQPIGAGNSVADASLAGALLGHALAHPTSSSHRAVGCLGLGSAAVLCLIHDIHGAAALIGCALFAARQVTQR